jgi:hypothetical protein
LRTHRTAPRLANGSVLDRLDDEYEDEGPETV